MQYVFYGLFIAASIAFFAYIIHRAGRRSVPAPIQSTSKSPDSFHDELDAYHQFLDGPGKLPDTLVFAENPFQPYLENFGPDGLRNHSGVSCWLKPAPGADLPDVLQDCMQWMDAHLAYYRSAKGFLHPLYCNQRIVILLESEEIPDGLLRDPLIRLAVVRSETTLFDLWDQQEYTVQAVNYPGSADDAATYGEWYLY